ncbi:MAG: hypothetical protein M1511_12730 [Deltaproteobacteria bacterium]|nr:hypothetical protein [Deltaproteobacteria bacterium]
MRNKRKIVPGGRYKYYIPPTEYVVNEIIMDATREESTGKLPQTVIYTQVIAGVYPIGTRYARRLDDFLGKVKKDGKLVKKFDEVKKPSQ